jgi:hypothetical protein
MADEAFLKLALGRSVAKLAKLALYPATRPIEGVLAPEEARSKDQWGMVLDLSRRHRCGISDLLSL